MLTTDQAKAAADALTQQSQTPAPAEVPINPFIMPLVAVLFAVAFGAATYFIAPGKPYFSGIGAALGVVVGRTVWRLTRAKQ